MRFGEIEIPAELLEAQAKNELVVFAGAGVSVEPPTSLPNFSGLFRQAWETLMPPGLRLASDHDGQIDILESFDILEGAVGVAVREHVKQIFLNCTKTNLLHKGLVNLFRPDQDIRIVTTNYDKLLSQQAKETRPQFKEHIYPSLIIDKTTPFQGIAYVHGSCFGESNNLVLTNTNVAHAYFGRNPVAKSFLEDVLSTGHIAFVGYSLNDPILKLLLRALPNQERLFAFCRISDSGKWRLAGVEPVHYRDGNEAHQHHHLVDALSIWSDKTQAGEELHTESGKTDFNDMSNRKNPDMSEESPE